MSHKLASFGLTLLMIFAGFAGLLVIHSSETAEAASVTIPCEMTGGTSFVGGQLEYDRGIGYVAYDYLMEVTGWYASGVIQMEKRSYVSFNSSAIPSGATISSATLHVWFDFNTAMATIKFYQGELGASLTTADWGCGAANGTFRGSTSSTNGWKTITVPGSAFGQQIGNHTQFEIVMDLPTSANWWTGVISDPGGDPSVNPYLTVSYSTGCEVTYEEAGGVTESCDVLPSYTAYNLTHDLYTVLFDTFTGVLNVSITKGSGWNHLGHTPTSTSATETTAYYNLTGVKIGVTYRVQFTVAVVRPVQAYVAMYMASTGEGFPFETFHVMLNNGLSYNNTTASDVLSPTVDVSMGGNYTVAILDFFGNVITSVPFVASSEMTFVPIPVDVNSFKVFNQQDDFTKIRIYYANATSPIEFFCAPNEPVETYLRDGNYSVGVTMYNNHTALTTVWFSPSVNGSEFILIQGNTISQVISDVAGVYSLQEVITTMVTPDVVMIAEDLPSVPDETIIFVHPWSVVAATVNVNGSGTSETLWLPHQNTTGSYYTVATDDLYLSGAWGTTIWVNYTNGTSFYHAHNLPSYLALDGGNFTVVTSASINFTRHTEWREETLFFYTYYTTQKKYEVILDINNSMTSDWTSVNWLIGLPENMIIDMSSVKVYDLDNALYLTAGKNYDVSATGIKMLFASLNSSNARHVRITMYDANASSEDVLAIAYTDSYVQSTYLGKAYFKSTASWTNGQGATYSDEIKVKLDFQDDEQRFIVASDIVIYDRVAGRALQSWEFTIADGVISIDHATVPVGEVQSYDVYFHLDMTTDGGFDLNTPIIVLPGGTVISVFVLAVFGVAGLGVVAYVKKSRPAGAMVLVAACILFIALIWDNAGAL